MGSGVRKYRTIAMPDWTMTPDDINAEASPANMPTPTMVPLNFISLAVLLRLFRFCS
jgi:hypothetical protein